jgi:hypothetical protein
LSFSFLRKQNKKKKEEEEEEVISGKDPKRHFILRKIMQARKKNKEKFFKCNEKKLFSFPACFHSQRASRLYYGSVYEQQKQNYLSRRDDGKSITPCAT